LNQFQNQRKDNNNYPRVTRFIGGGDEEYIPTQKELDEAQEDEEKKSGFVYSMKRLFQNEKKLYESY
jgi:hypothetical protein